MKMVSRPDPAASRHPIGARFTAMSGAFVFVALSSCAPVELPGDPVQACRSGIREACAFLALQQRSMQQLVRPIPVHPVQVYRSRGSRTNCQRLGNTMQCQTSYQ
ncbi:hypothetical protein [Paracoccus binzhouensis]|uniref:hypothetical protein n=1 Tax=Paracoccus binzhouensis TaxID=2796149 RepID=UPI0018EF2CF9|nr:hypothetical protein [Paracoccus binzhouensis]